MDRVKARRLNVPRPPAEFVYIEPAGKGRYKVCAPGDADDGKKISFEELAAGFDPVSLPGWLAADIEAAAQAAVDEAEKPEDLGLSFERT